MFGDIALEPLGIPDLHLGSQEGPPKSRRDPGVCQDICFPLCVMNQVACVLHWPIQNHSWPLSWESEKSSRHQEGSSGNIPNPLLSWGTYKCVCVCVKFQFSCCLADF